MPLIQTDFGHVDEAVLTCFESVIFRFLNVKHHKFSVLSNGNVFNYEFSAEHIFNSKEKVKKKHSYKEWHSN